MEADEVGRRRSVEGGFPGGADEGETMGRRAGGESYHDTKKIGYGQQCLVLEVLIDKG